MVQRNIILSKKLTPYITIVALLFGVGIYGAVNSAVSLNRDTKGNKNVGSYILISGFSSVGVLLAAMFLFCVLEMRGLANEFTSRTVRLYIKRLIQEHPELSEFQSVLDNPDALKRLAAMISNELRPSEQKQVSRILDEIEKIDPNDAERETKLENIRQNIGDIIKSHAMVHPEFIEKVRSVVLSENHKAYIKQQQMKNAMLIKKSKTNKR